MSAGIMSISMVLMLLGLVARNFIRNVKDPPPGGEWRFIRMHIDAYLLSLLGSEILQGIGAIMNVKWVLEGVVYCSDYCSVQGALKTIGETGVGMNTMVRYRDRLPIVLYSAGDSYCAVLTRAISQAITIHTFIVIFFRWIPSPQSVWIYRTVITFIWSYPVLFVIIASFVHRRDNPTDPAGLFVRPLFTQPFSCLLIRCFRAQFPTGAGSLAATSNE
jgi:hypothetical protein